MSEEHTPGPWYVLGGDSVWHDLGDTAYKIADLNNWAEETAPNARLIASAPDLLAALTDLLESIDLHHDCMSGTIDREALEPWIEIAEAAIAKAEGQP